VAWTWVRAVHRTSRARAPVVNLIECLAHHLYEGQQARSGAAAWWERVGFVTSHEEEFVEFAAASAPRLRRAAFLLCGDWHTAEDLAQTALAKVFVSWRKVRRQDAAYAYATRTLVNSYLADKRLRRSAEILTDHLPDCPAPVLAPETRMVVLLAALVVATGDQLGVRQYCAERQRRQSSGPAHLWQGPVPGHPLSRG